MKKFLIIAVLSLFSYAFACENCSAMLDDSYNYSFQYGDYCVHFQDCETFGVMSKAKFYYNSCGVPRQAKLQMTISIKNEDREILKKIIEEYKTPNKVINYCTERFGKNFIRYTGEMYEIKEGGYK